MMHEGSIQVTRLRLGHEALRCATGGELSSLWGREIAREIKKREPRAGRPGDARARGVAERQVKSI